MVELQQLSVGYGSEPVLRDLNLTVTPGLVLVLAGPNGSGKSTLLKAMAGLLPVSGGEIRFDGQAIGAFSNKTLARTVAYLPQNRTVPEITALQLVLHGRFPYLSYPRRYGARDLDIARKALARMGVSDLENRELSTLSGGQQQKVYIAMALAQDTPVVLLDEPTTFLDIAHQLQLMEQARLLADEGKAVVLVLHDLILALETADRLAILNRGSLKAWGDPQAVFQSGCLDEVFGVGVRRFDGPDGPHYYYERR